MKTEMRHMKSTVTGTLQEKNGRFYMVLRIPDSTGKLHQKWVSTGLPVQGNQRRASCSTRSWSSCRRTTTAAPAKPAGPWPKSVRYRSTRLSAAG